MADVKILHAGGVGGYAQGEVVKDAHAGLVEIATKGVVNAADGQPLAELVGGKKSKSKDGGEDAVQSEDSQP
jgi:hypothetical protein